ncbi:MAG: Multidrug resistance protein MdtA [Legionellaceae bacterium]
MVSRKKIYLLAVIVLIIITFISCRKQDSHSTLSQTNATFITVTKPAYIPLENTETALGTLSSLNAPLLRAETNGRIIKLLADVGQAVKKGQLLGEIDPTDNRNSVASSIAQVAQLKAQWRFQSLTVQRMRKLIKTGVISQSNLDEAQAKLRAFDEQIKAASAQMNSAEYQLKRSQIIAPVDGLIQSRLISEGDFITIGNPLFELVTLNQLRATLLFPETVRSLLNIGQAVELKTPSLPGSSVPSVIKQLTPLLDPTNRSVSAIIEFTNPGGWQPGASVTGIVTIVKKNNVLVIPQESVVNRPRGTVVYIIKNNNAIECLITTGNIKGNWIEVVQGLTPNDVIAKDGAGYLTDHSPVTIKKSL